MKVDLGIWSKLTKVVGVLILVAVLLLVGLWYFPLIQQNERLRKEVLRLDGLIRKEEATKKQSVEAIEALSSDPKTIERLAREKLGYAKPGETIIRFEPATNPATRR